MARRTPDGNHLKMPRLQSPVQRGILGSFLGHCALQQDWIARRLAMRTRGNDRIRAIGMAFSNSHRGKGSSFSCFFPVFWTFPCRQVGNAEGRQTSIQQHQQKLQCSYLPASQVYKWSLRLGGMYLLARNAKIGGKITG